MSAAARVLALIPARAGSKRLPGKNIKPLHGKPLLAWTVEFACGVAELDDVLVSTDAESIAAVARQYGAQVPWLRPAELASDTASSVAVIQHALAAQAAAGKHYQYLVLLQPTTPFRDEAMLREALRRCQAADGAPVWAFAAAKSHPQWCYKRQDDGHFHSYITASQEVSRSQDLPAAYQASGSFYVIGVQRFLSSANLGGEDLQGVLSNDPVYDSDIDDIYDWMRAEAIAALRFGGDALATHA